MITFQFDRETTSRADEQSVQRADISFPDNFTASAMMEVLVQRNWIPTQSNMVWILCCGEKPVAFLFRNKFLEKQIYQTDKTMTAAEFPSRDLHAYHRYYGAIDYKGLAFRDLLQRVLADWGLPNGK
ncbi:MAG: hypothetical protein IJ091_02205 [Oscillospiraceae bacterium]|nr:hypothetical protein [Oscillospiraceae bacterium]